MRKLGLLILTAVGLAGCKGEEHQLGGPFREMAVLKSSKNFEIPKALRERIEKNYVKFFHDQKPSTIETDEELLDKIPRDFLEIDVYFSQEDPGALKNDFVMRSPRGGGLIDLAGQVIGAKGSFYVRFDVRVPDGHSAAAEPGGESAAPQELGGFQAYFISGTPKRKIGDETFGADCGTLVDITNSVLESKKSRGLRVNATEDRYYNTLVGDYFFVSYGMDKIYIAAVMLDDSSVTYSKCPERAPK